jgi:hypothetical protein
MIALTRDEGGTDLTTGMGNRTLSDNKNVKVKIALMKVCIEAKAETRQMLPSSSRRPRE